MKKHSYLAFICCFILFILSLCACDANAQQIVTTTEDVVQQTTARDDRKTALEASVSVLKDAENKSTVASQSNAASKVDEIQVEVTTTEQIYFDYDTLIPFEGTVEYYEDVYEEEIAETEVYEEPVYYSGGTLSMEEFYWMWYNMEDVSWEDCLAASGMDEWSLLVCAGWTVREGYTWCDPYLAYLCGMCPFYYYDRGVNIGYGLSGYGSDSSYYDESLADYGYGISQTEIDLLYLSIIYRNPNVFGCDGVSWYNDAYCIYGNWDGYAWINVWSY